MYASYNDIDDEMVKTLIRERIGVLNIQDHLNEPSNYFQQESFTMNEDLYLSFSSVLTPPQPYNISSFSQLGISDPFPQEPIETDYTPPTHIDDLVYPRSRYIFGNIPNACFIPSKRVMWKLMRSCIDIEYPEDLWFNFNEAEQKKKQLRLEIISKMTHKVRNDFVNLN